MYIPRFSLARDRLVIAGPLLEQWILAIGRLIKSLDKEDLSETRPLVPVYAEIYNPLFLLSIPGFSGIETVEHGESFQSSNSENLIFEACAKTVMFKIGDARLNR